MFVDNGRMLHARTAFEGRRRVGEAEAGRSEGERTRESTAARLAATIERIEAMLAAVHHQDAQLRGAGGGEGSDGGRREALTQVAAEVSGAACLLAACPCFPPSLYPTLLPSLALLPSRMRTR